MGDRQKLVILGTYSFSEEVADLVGDGDDYELTAFAENDERARCEQPVLGLPVIWIDDAGPLAATHQAACAIGTTHRSRFVEQAVAMGFDFATIRHPTARVSRASTIGEGSILSAGVVVGSHTSVGRHVIANRGVLIGHHTTIGDYVTLSPGANIAGRVTIGAGTYVGIGAIVLDDLTIGRGSVIGAGAVVTKDVPDHVQVLGVPARITKEGVEGR